MTFKERIENYWFYYKNHTIVGVFVLIFLIVTMSQCAENRTPNDFSLAYVSAVYRDTQALEDEIKKAVGDLDGNGTVKVFCENINIPENPQTEMDLMMGQKLMLTFVDGEHRIYIMDKEFFQAQTYADMFEDLSGIYPAEVLENAVDNGGKSIAISTLNCPALEGVGLSDPQLYVGVTVISEDNKKAAGIEKRRDTAFSLLGEWINGDL